MRMSATLKVDDFEPHAGASPRSASQPATSGPRRAGADMRQVLFICFCLTAFGAVSFVFACALGSLLARPLLLALPVMLLWTITLLEARDRGQAPPLWLAGVMALWANLHGSFVFGFLVVASLALEELIEARARPW